MPSFRAFGAAVIFAATATISITGCDTSTGKADKQIHQNVSTAVAQLNGSEQDRAQAESLLQSASQLTNASSASSIDVQELRGQLELRDAQELQPKIDSQQADIHRLIWDIQQLGGQIQASNQLATALNQYDPASIQAALSKSISQVQGSADSANWGTTGSIPTLTTVATNISTLQAQLDQLQATIKSLTDQRAAQLAQADQLNQTSEKTKGDKSLDLFKQGATARKKADELSVQIDENNVKLARVQTHFDVAQGQQNMLNAAVKDLTGKADQSTGAWKTVQQQIENQKAQAKALVGQPGQTANPDDPTGGLTLVSKVATLNKKLETLRALREEAETHLNNATDRFKDAAQLAISLQSKLQLQITDPKNQTRAESAAWKDQASTMHPARYQLQGARALERRAALAAGRAADANAISQLAQNLKPTLDQLQEALPAPLNDSDNKIAGDIKTGRQLADESYDAANELLKGVDEGSAPEDQKNAARISSIFTQYGWYLLSSSANDPKAATAHLDEAKAQRDAVVQNGFDVKLLPPELAVSTTPTPPK
jgi:hypothetical protein